jgi:hypothetical protein
MFTLTTFLLLGQKSTDSNNKMIYPHRDLLKTDARFGLEIPTRETEKKDVENDEENFDWRKHRILSEVRNQGTCGSCWAVATTTAVADHFAVRSFEKQSPKLSYTRSLICYSESPCEGGNPAALLKMASESETGFVEEACISESTWCGSGGCSPEHFKSVLGKCGCQKDSEFKCYPVDKGSVQWLIDDKGTEDFSSFVKHWLKKEGPLIAAFPVFTNFKPILFEKDIYIETKTAENEFNLSALEPREFVGFHAVVVVGYGVEHGVTTGFGRQQSVPYWLCRNSWGQQWNRDGHFKMPCYPFNSTVQFEKSVNIQDQKQSNIVHAAGGFVSFTTSQKPFLKKIPKTITVIDIRPQWQKFAIVIASFAALATLFLVVLKYNGRRL